MLLKTQSLNLIQPLSQLFNYKMVNQLAERYADFHTNSCLQRTEITKVIFESFGTNLVPKLKVFDPT